MAIKKLQILLKKLFSNGDEYHIYFQTRAKDVIIDENTNEKLSSYVNKLKTMSENAVNVQASNNNGYIKINNTETKVYEHPNSGVIPGNYNGVTVDNKGHVTAAWISSDWIYNVSGNVTEGKSYYTKTGQTNVPNPWDHLTMGAHLGILYHLMERVKGLAFSDQVAFWQLDGDVQNRLNNAIPRGDIYTPQTWDSENTEWGKVLSSSATYHYRRKFADLERRIANLENTTRQLLQADQNILSTMANINKWINIVVISDWTREIPLNNGAYVEVLRWHVTITGVYMIVAQAGFYMDSQDSVIRAELIREADGGVIAEGEKSNIRHGRNNWSSLTFSCIDRIPANSHILLKITSTSAIRTTRNKMWCILLRPV